MELGVIGLGRMGGNIVRRLQRAGHATVGYARRPEAIAALTDSGMRGVGSLADLVEALAAPRAIWLMVPAAAVESTLAELVPLLAPGDTVIDGGNSSHRDDIARSSRLAERGIDYVDVGTSGGVFGLERAFSLMIGGDAAAVRRLDPIFAALAPGIAAEGYLHCGPSGAGHFVKTVHNGIEYGLMASYAEGLNILRHAGIGGASAAIDAETAPMREPELYRYEFDLADVAEVWRRGSVVASWLLDLTASALARSPALDGFTGRASDSGEGRWTIAAAIDEGVPAPVLTAALYARFSSRGEADFADRMLSAMRREFGGHVERTEIPAV